MQNQTSPLILTFGVTDPVGATGIQADLATFSSLGCYGLSVVTAILISDTTRIEDMQYINADWVADQARALLEDMPIAAFKIGAIGSVENVSAIAEIVSDYPDIPLILSPFLSVIPDQDQDSEDLLIAIRELLIPQTTIMLLSTAELLQLAETWREPSTEDLLDIDAMHIIELGCEYLFVTGTTTTEITNTLFNQAGVLRKDNCPRISGSFNGVGSTLSAAITAMLANGLEVSEAISEAQEFAFCAINAAQQFGMGKFIPDRFFWIREDLQDDLPEEDKLNTPFIK